MTTLSIRSHRMAGFALLCALCFGNASAETIELAVFAPGLPIHEAVVSTAVTLPEGWSLTASNGTWYFIGAGKVYGSMTLSYSANSIANYTLQFGMPDPPVRTVDGEAIRFVGQGATGTYSRKLEATWFLKASVNAYPDYQDEDLMPLLEEFLVIVASAEPALPAVEEG